MADAISIEETNKVRIALGLKPLPVPGAGPTFKEDSSSDSDSDDQTSTLEKRQGAAGDNWKRLEDEREAKRKRIERSEAIKKACEAAQKITRLKGKGLGEADEDAELDTRTWLVQQKKRQEKLNKERERARRVEQELRDREERGYSSRDLAGVKVAHAAKDFEEEGGEQVLTLKDATIEENEEEGDELENLQLVEKEKLNEKLNLKKKKPVYNPNDEGEDGPKVLLQQYDEVIDGKKRKRFMLDGEGFMAQEQTASQKNGTAGSKNQAISLDILKDLPASDYQEPSEVKMKKPKKKKDKSTRRKAAEDDDVSPMAELNGDVTNGDTMDVDETPSISNKPSKPASTFVDDEDLQSALTEQRRAVLKKRKKMKPEDLARQIEEERAATPVTNNEGAADDGGLVIDETSEFVANLQVPEAKATRRSSTPQSNGHQTPAVKSESGEDEDVDMDRSYQDVAEDGERAARVKREAAAAAALPETGLDEEQALSKGIGAAFNLLKQRNLVTPSDGDALTRRFRDQQDFIAQKRGREEAAAAKARRQRETGPAGGWSGCRRASARSTRAGRTSTATSWSRARWPRSSIASTGPTCSSSTWTTSAAA